MRAKILVALLSILTSVSAAEAFPIKPAMTAPAIAAHYYNNGFFLNRYWGQPYGYGYGYHHRCHRHHRRWW